jgi:proteasome lid subunit RPN8/RPN11
MFYAWSVDAEVGGYGRVIFVQEKNDIHIEELFLVKQEVHQTECNLKAEGTAALYQELIDKGEPKKVDELTLWWHSHKNMGASFSTIDDELMRTWPGSYLVSLVVNRDGKMSAQLMSKSPLLVVGDISVGINWFDVPEAKKWEAEIEKKVTKTKPVQYIPQQNTKKVGANKGTNNNKHIMTMTDEEWNSYQIEEDERVIAEIAEWQKLIDEDEDMDEIEKSSIRQSVGW